MTEIADSGPHSVSGNYAYLDDDGDSAWLYLTGRGGLGIVADCWLYNRRNFDRSDLSSWPRDRPPPAPNDSIEARALRASPPPDAVSFLWNSGGDSVAVSVEEEVLGFIAAGSKRGHSLYLRTTGPWGSPFDGALFKRIFRRPAA
jgi:hypothetical protein